MSVIGINFKLYEPLCVSEQKTIKTRKLNGVSAEMSLNVLAYNFKRVMKILGTSGLMKALSA